MSTLHDIERAIEALSPQELDELCAWLDQHHPQPIDSRIEADLEAGRLDGALLRALEDEANGRVTPL